MLYQFLRVIVLIAIRLFFKSIRLKNIHNIPSKGALILAANHPSTFLDPLVGALFISRKIHFLANGSLYKIPIVAWLLKQFYTIPIYRQQDSKTASNQNEDSFRACYELLEAKGAIIIFPEGTSENERKLRKVKTGTARIALGAAAKNNFDLDVNIVCVGINYTNPRKFQSRLMVSFDAPIILKKYKESYLEDQVKTVQNLTNEIKERLESMIVVTETKAIDELVEKIESIYTSTLKQELSIDAPDTEQIFTIAQHFADAVHYFEANSPARVIGLQTSINQYFDTLKKYKLSDKVVVHPVLKWEGKLRGALYIILGFPFYVLGLMHNFLPYQIPAILTKTFTKDITFQAPMNISFGIFTFLSFYTAYGISFYYFVPHVWFLLLYLLSIAFMGFFTYRYWHFFLDLIGKWRIANLSANTNFQALLALRVSVIKELEIAKKEYLERLNVPDDSL
jgi:1-acyl-sn-glycerol-3-phosphate acyltransferase